MRDGERGAGNGMKAGERGDIRFFPSICGEEEGDCLGWEADLAFEVGVYYVACGGCAIWMVLLVGWLWLRV